MFRYIILSLSLLSMLACTQPNTTSEFESAIVVEAYLYAGQSVKGIELSALIPFGADSTVVPDWDLVEVEILHNGEVFPLSQRTPGSHIFDEASEMLLIEAGQTYVLSIRYQEETLTAETTVPTKPTNFQLSENTIALTQIDFSQGPGALLGGIEIPDPIEVSWDNPA
ncbi:MAG: DUF4249 family protein, partial [Bacteroidota bacterium]